MPQAKQTLHLFDRFSLSVASDLKCRFAASDGPRSLSLSDDAERFVISFEEGMQLMDMLPTQRRMLCCQCCKDGKFLHLRRELSGRHAFFHLELDDAEGGTVYLPGQMKVSADYQWSDGVEPVLMGLLEGIALL